MAPIELEISIERVIPIAKVESTYFRGNIVLEIGEMRLDTDLIVNQHFGTDSIIEHNARRNPNDIRRAFEILTHGEPQDYAFNPAYNQAVRLLRGNGPHTGFSELVETEPLSEDQTKMLEELLISNRAFKKVHGIKENLFRFKGKRRKGYLPLYLAYDHCKDGIFEVSNGKSTLGATLGIDGILDMQYSYARSTFSASRDWLTGVVDMETACAFITHWESKSPEERASDFLNTLREATKGKVSPKSGDGM